MSLYSQTDRNHGSRYENMTALSFVKLVMAIILSGIAGTIANSIVVAYWLNISFIDLALSPGRNTVAILVAAFIPFVLGHVVVRKRLAAAIAFSTIAPSILAKLVFGLEFPWTFVLAVNLVYGVAATYAFVCLRRFGTIRE
ncbi:MAG: hypothetical protein ABJN26_13270 [Stappiaceae bacterium]